MELEVKISQSRSSCSCVNKSSCPPGYHSVSSFGKRKQRSSGRCSPCQERGKAFTLIELARTSIYIKQITVSVATPGTIKITVDILQRIAAQNSLKRLLVMADPP